MVSGASARPRRDPERRSVLAPWLHVVHESTRAGLASPHAGRSRSDLPRCRTDQPVLESSPLSLLTGLVHLHRPGRGSRCPCASKGVDSQRASHREVGRSGRTHSPDLSLCAHSTRMDHTIRLLKELVAIDSVNPSLVPARPARRRSRGALVDELRSDRTAGRGAGSGPRPAQRGRHARRPRAGPVADVLRPHRYGRRGRHDAAVRSGGARRPHLRPRVAGHEERCRGHDRRRARRLRNRAASTPAASSSPASSTKSTRASAPTRWSRAGVPTAAVVTEPTDLAVAVAHKGFEWVEIETEGRAAHGSRPRDGRDAIVRMGRVLGGARGARSRACRPDARTRWSAPASLHASLIEGGRELSSYPDRCSLQIERRTIPGEPQGSAAREVGRILDRAARDRMPSFAPPAEMMFSRAPYEIAPVTRAAGRARVGARSGRRRQRRHRHELLDRRGGARRRRDSLGAVRSDRRRLHGLEEWVESSRC